MFNIEEFEEYIGQPLHGKAVLCWSKKLGYLFLNNGQNSGDYKVVGVKK